MKKLLIALSISALLWGQKINQVALKPAKITVKTDVKAEVDPPIPPEGYSYSYTWFVNGTPININSVFLPSSYFKKGDFIWVGVKLVDNETGKVVDYAESLRVRVSDIPPDIVSSPPSAKGLKPGDTYVYEIVVEDEDDPPEDVKITLKKAPPGAVLEGNVLRWKLPKKTGKFTFVIEASDPSGGKCTLSFEISIGKKKVYPSEGSTEE